MTQCSPGSEPPGVHRSHRMRRDIRTPPSPHRRCPHLGLQSLHGADAHSEGGQHQLAGWISRGKGLQRDGRFFHNGGRPPKATFVRQSPCNPPTHLRRASGRSSFTGVTEQEFQIVYVNSDMIARFAQRDVGEVRLVLLQFHDPVFDGIGGDQLIDEDRFGLADPVRPDGGLRRRGSTRDRSGPPCRRT